MNAKLELGEEVKVFEHVGEWALVMAMPEGPAGFISERLLGKKKPIALLARELAFSACEPADDYTRDDIGSVLSAAGLKPAEPRRAYFSKILTATG